MRVGILGGTRFIGFHLTQALLETGAEVSLFHRGRTVEPKPFNGRVARVFGDRDQPATISPFFQKSYDAVFDLSGYKLGQIDPILSGWRRKIGHYIFCSTASVYRTPPPLHFDEEAPRILEMGTYGGDKALAEEAILEAGKRDWPVTIFRPQGVFGPFHDQQALYIMRRLWAREPVLLRPDFAGKKINFLWVQDLVAHFIRAIGEPRAFGQAFNVAGSESHTPESFGLLLERIVGAGKFETVMLDRRLSKRLPDLGLPWLDHDLVPSNKKLLQRLGAVTPLDEALSRTWEWCRADSSALRLRRQRWEKQAGQGRSPGWGDRLSWRLYDRIRRNPVMERILKSPWTVRLRNFVSS